MLELDDGPSIYFAGDTNVFGDMALIARLYAPDVAVLPIGDHFTMGPREAAVALELLGVKRCVPCHYGTFPLLTGTPASCASCAPGVEIARAGAGRRRWSCEGALVRRNGPARAGDRARGLARRRGRARPRRCHGRRDGSRGARAGNAGRRRASRRKPSRPRSRGPRSPACSCPTEELLALDLTELTYG